MHINKTVIVPKIQYSNIGFLEIPDYISYLIYFQGCLIKCKNCQNDILLNFENGNSVKIDDFLENINENVKSCVNYINFFTFLGGEPLDQISSLAEIILKLKSSYSDKKICIYTGYNIEFFYKQNQNNSELLTILENVDIIKDGNFDNINIFAINTDKNKVKKQRFLIKNIKNTKKDEILASHNKILLNNHTFLDFYPSFTEKTEENKKFIGKMINFLIF